LYNFTNPKIQIAFYDGGDQSTDSYPGRNSTNTTTTTTTPNEESRSQKNQEELDSNGEITGASLFTADRSSSNKYENTKNSTDANKDDVGSETKFDSFTSFNNIPVETSTTQESSILYKEQVSNSGNDRGYTIDSYSSANGVSFWDTTVANGTISPTSNSSSSSTTTTKANHINATNIFDFPSTKTNQTSFHQSEGANSSIIDSDSTDGTNMWYSPMISGKTSNDSYLSSELASHGDTAYNGFVNFDFSAPTTENIAGAYPLLVDNNSSNIGLIPSLIGSSMSVQDSNSNSSSSGVGGNSSDMYTDTNSSRLHNNDTLATTMSYPFVGANDSNTENSSLMLLPYYGSNAYRFANVFDSTTSSNDEISSSPTLLSYSGSSNAYRFSNAFDWAQPNSSVSYLNLTDNKPWHEDNSLSQPSSMSGNQPSTNKALSYTPAENTTNKYVSQDDELQTEKVTNSSTSSEFMNSDNTTAMNMPFYNSLGGAYEWLKKESIDQAQANKTINDAKESINTSTNDIIVNFPSMLGNFSLMGLSDSLSYSNHVSQSRGTGGTYRSSQEQGWSNNTNNTAKLDDDASNVLASVSGVTVTGNANSPWNVSMKSSFGDYSNGLTFGNHSDNIVLVSNGESPAISSATTVHRPANVSLTFSNDTSTVPNRVVKVSGSGYGTSTSFSGQFHSNGNRSRNSIRSGNNTSDDNTAPDRMDVSWKHQGVSLSMQSIMNHSNYYDMSSVKKVASVGGS
jgi:hypothetical protein